MALPSHSGRRRYYSRRARASPVSRLGSGRRRVHAGAVPVFISFVQGGVSRYQETYTL